MYHVITEPVSSNEKSASIEAQTSAYQGLKESLNYMLASLSDHISCIQCKSILQPEMEWIVINNHLSKTVTFTNIVSS